MAQYQCINSFSIILPGIDPLLDDNEVEVRIVVIRKHVGQLGTSAFLDVPEGGKELLNLVCLGRLHLAVGHAVAEDDDVLRPLAVDLDKVDNGCVSFMQFFKTYPPCVMISYLPILDKCLGKRHFQGIDKLLPLLLHGHSRKVPAHSIIYGGHYPGDGSTLEALVMEDVDAHYHNVCRRKVGLKEHFTFSGRQSS